MKKSTLKLLLALLVLLVGALGWGSQAVAADADSGTVTTIFDVEGMTCGGCEASVKIKVKKLDGVVAVDASYKKGEATVTYDPNKVTTDQIIAAIDTLGYTATVRETKEATSTAAGTGLLAKLRSCC